MKRISILPSGRKKIKPGTVAVVALLPLILIFAVFEYRWLDAASRQDELKMRAGIRGISESFLLDLNLEMMLARTMLSAPDSPDPQTAGRDLSGKLSEYRHAARFPALVRTVYVLYPDDGLYALDERGRSLVPARDHLAILFPDDAGGKSGFFRQAVISDGEFISYPGGLLGVSATYTQPSVPGRLSTGGPDLQKKLFPEPAAALLIDIDTEVLVKETIPLLIDRHFSQESGYGDYSVRIMNRENLYVYRNTGKIVLADSPDVRLPLFDGGPVSDMLYLFSGAGPGEPVRESPFSIAESTVYFSGEETLGIVKGARSVKSVRNGNGFVFFVPKADEVVAITKKIPDSKVRVFVSSSVTQSEGPSGTAIRQAVEKKTVPVKEPGWYLDVQHPSGGIERAAGQEKLRNLAVSYGMLLLLYASVIVFHQAGRRAGRISERERNFIASVSHELKTPVAIIRSASENMASGIIRSPEKTEQYGALIREESGRLAGMIERVLLVSGMSSGVFRAGCELLDVDDLIAESAERIRAALEKRCVRLIRTGGGTPFRVRGDRTLLCSALENLLSNAVKYGPEESSVEIAVSEEFRGRRKFCEIRIADSGPGVPGKERRRIFEPFYRGKTAVETQVQGSGLGLSLALGIARAHGGTIRYEALRPTGSAFVLRLPSSEPAEGEPS